MPLQKRLSGRRAELLKVRLGDVTSRRLGTKTLMRGMCESCILAYAAHTSIKASPDPL